MESQIVKFNTNEELTEYFINKYSETNDAIPVSFRALFPKMNKIDRYTHLIHSYPAKLLVHIPYFFLNNTIFSKKGDTVLDPFCGTGTVLLEAIIFGRNSVGADSNPLARLIGRVKTQWIEEQELRDALFLLIKRATEIDNYDIPDVINRDFWFPLSTQIQLAKIRNAISELLNENIRSFFEVCFSNCIKKVSYADPRIAVPVKLNPNRFPALSERNQKIRKRLLELACVDVFEKFRLISIDNINRINSLKDLSLNAASNVISDNAQKLTTSLGNNKLLKDGCIDLILTSPPYAGAQKYIRSSSLNLGWLGLTKEINLKNLDRMNIGRENYSSNELSIVELGIKDADILIKKTFPINKLRAFIVCNYLVEMKTALDESIRVLKPGGHFIIVIGNNKVCGFEFNTQEYLTEYIKQKGLVLVFKLIDDIKSYGLMTKRNKTADIISREWILVFKK